MQVHMQSDPAGNFFERPPWPPWPASTSAHSSLSSTRSPPWRREPAPRTIAPWSASICRAATTATAPSSPPIPTPLPHSPQARSGAPGLAYPLSESAAHHAQDAAERPHLRAQSRLTGVQNLFNAGRAAIVANTGTLIAPATKTQINANSVPLPDSLFSHFDQTAAWQAIASNLGSGEHVGWGGAVADAIEAMNMNSNSMFTCISTCRQRALPRRANLVPAQRHARRSHPHLRACRSRPSACRPRPIRSTPSSPPKKPTSSPRNTKSSSSAPSRRRQRWPRPWLPAGAGGVPNPPQYLDPITNMLADNPLAASLQTVARIIAGRGPLGVTRQIFYVQLGSFDTHDDQAAQPRAASHPAWRGVRILRRPDGQHGTRQQRHRLHHLRLRPHPHLQQRRHRSRLGQPPLRRRRRGAGQRHVRPVSGRRRRSGQRRRRRPPHSHHRRRAIRRYARAAGSASPTARSAPSFPTSATSAPAPTWASWASRNQFLKTGCPIQALLGWEIQIRWDDVAPVSRPAVVRASTPAQPHQNAVFPIQAPLGWEGSAVSSRGCSPSKLRLGGISTRPP